MALTFGFYDSLNHDRLYNAQQMSAIFDGIINDGVFASVGSHFSVVPGTGMHVLVKSGRAWFNSTWTLNDSDIDLTIDAADSLLGRIDTVVLEVNSEQATRANSIKVVKGTAASTPAKPTLTNTTTVHQHPLAHITVAKNTTAITASMIEIVVGKTDCPFVTAILQTTDITNLFEKWENDFQTWFSTVRSTLDGDVALNLQNQIDANWRKTLRETTPPKIGLASTATPADMFDVLADVGNLHVWRKTVTTTEEVPAVPAGYTLGDSLTIDLWSDAYTDASNGDIGVWKASSVDVSAVGDINLTGKTSLTQANIDYIMVAKNGADYNEQPSNVIEGCRNNFIYLRIYGSSNQNINTQYLNKYYYVSNDAAATRTISSDGSYVTVTVSGIKEVTGYPYTPAIPAGTSVTYPVSTNRNAYQEGSDAKPAGYVLGDVVSGTFELRPASGNETTFWSYGEALSVSNDGTISISSSTGSEDYVTLRDSSTTTVNKARLLLGKYVSPSGSVPSPFVREAVYFIPSDAEINLNTSGLGPFVSKYQPVTGYPAIPAGTVIEYLGCLGDKARVQVLSYVGTGTQGASNPCSITADFPMKMVVYAFAENLTTSAPEYIYQILDWVSTSYSSKQGLGSDSNGTLMGKKSADSKTLSWYIDTSYTDQAWVQLNVSGKKYTFLAIG